MKIRIFASLVAIVLSSALLAACQPPPPATANDVQRDQQAAMNSEGVAAVGMPNIVNHRDQRAVKFWYERRDQANLLTYTYTRNMEGRWVWYCDSIGYPIPGGTQYSAPTAMQRYRVRDPRYPASDVNGWDYGIAALPQAEPNGVFPPSTAEGSGAICINPRTNQASASYAEDKLNTFEYPQPNAINEPDRSVHRPAAVDPLVPPAH